MDLVDEEDDLAFALRDFGDDGLQTFFKFALILRTSDQGTHIEGVDLLGAEVFGDVTTDDTEGQTFCDSRLTDTRLPDEDGVILRTTGEDLQDTTDLIVTTDDRVELTATSTLAEVDSVLAEGVVLLLGVLAGDAVALTQLVDSLTELCDLQAEVTLQKSSDRGVDLSESEEEVLESYILILHLGGDVLSLVEYFRSIGAEIGFATRDLRQSREHTLQALLKAGTLDSELREEEVSKTISESQNTCKQVNGLNGLIAGLASKLDSALQGLLRLDGILINVHFYVRGWTLVPTLHTLLQSTYPARKARHYDIQSGITSHKRHYHTPLCRTYR